MKRKLTIHTIALIALKLVKYLFNLLDYTFIIITLIKYNT